MNPDIEITKLNGEVALVKQEIQQANKTLEKMELTLKDLVNTLPSIRNDVNRANEGVIGLKIDVQKFIERYSEQSSEVDIRMDNIEKTVQRHDFIWKTIATVTSPVIVWAVVNLIQFFITRIA